MLLLAVCAWLTVSVGVVPARTVMFDGLYVADPLATFLKLAAFLTSAWRCFTRRPIWIDAASWAASTTCWASRHCLGICVLISANNLITVYLGVELLSLSLYAMVAFDRESGIAAEAAIKYFVLGAIASGTLLYGMSILYGLTGTLELDKIATINAGHGAGFVIAVTFIVVAVAFKFGAVPFHMWVPDVYRGRRRASRC